MDVLYLILPVALLIAIVFLIAFIMNVKRGQYDDLETSSHRMLIDDEPVDKEELNERE